MDGLLTGAAVDAAQHRSLTFAMCDKIQRSSPWIANLAVELRWCPICW